MVFINNNDTFTVKLNTLLADYDRDTVVNLYQPLIGYVSIALYFTLWSEANNQKIVKECNHESLLVKMQLPTGEFIKARKNLEAVGLIRTKVESFGINKVFHYDIFAPKTPNEFFNDTLLYGLLIKCIGDAECTRLKNIYISNSNESIGEEISATFNEVFHPNYEDPSFIKAIESSKSIGRNHAIIDIQFSYEKLFAELSKISQINEKAFTKKDLKEISRLASLYGIDETNAASIVANNYDPSKEKGNRLDYDSIIKAFMDDTDYAYLSNRKKATPTKAKTISSKNALASKINIMESTSPKDFLTLLQNGCQPASADLKIINYISQKFNLTNPVINVIVEYVLTINKNILSRAYTEKIAASVSREGITTALDAMNYLKSINDTKSSYSSKEVVKTNKTNKKDDDCNNQESWDDIMDKLKIDNGDNNYGEAF